jgi:hypothetical protein
VCHCLLILSFIEINIFVAVFMYIKFLYSSLSLGDQFSQRNNLYMCMHISPSDLVQNVLNSVFISHSLEERLLWN